MIFSGSNSYTGDTNLVGGALSVNQSSLSETTAVKIATGATMNLNFNGEEQVGSVWLNGVQQGLDGAIFSSATDPTYFSGSGSLYIGAPAHTWSQSSWLGDWNDVSNWGGTYIPNGPGKWAVFSGSDSKLAATNVAVTLGRLDLLSTAPIAITGLQPSGTLTMQADPLNQSAGAQINVSGGTVHKINLPLIFNSPTVVNLSAGSTLEIGDPVNLNGQTVTKTGGGTLLFDVNFSADSGTLQANAGAVAVGAQAIVSPSLLDISGNSQLTGSGTIQSTVLYESSAASRFDGSIVGAGNSLIVNAGSGSLTLTGSNTYRGGTEVLGGTLIEANASAIADGSSLIVGSRTTLFDIAIPDAAAATAPQPVPEPSTFTLIAAATALLAGDRWRSRKNGMLFG